MCLSCWDDVGRPWSVTDAVKHWTPKFSEATGAGALHVVVEDWNLDDADIEFCLGQKPTNEERALCEALLAMSDGERWATAILSDYPYFKPEEYDPDSAPMDHWVEGTA